MLSDKIQEITLENLLIDLHNPRYDPRTGQREALATIAHDQGVKLFNLAEDIVEKGLNPSDLPMVTPADEAGIFVVLEGNRRIATLKLLSSPTLLTTIGLQAGILKRYQALCDRAKDILPKTINCVVIPREDAKSWILLKHTGENEGIGIVSWDGRARQRFRGTSPSLQAIDLVEKSDYIDDETRSNIPKIAITNIERVLNTPDARKLLGVDVKGDKLTLKPPEEQALWRLAILVSEVASRHIKVTDLDTKEQRIQYAKDVASQPLPKQKPGSTATTPATATAKRKATRIPTDRKTLIPKRLKLTIPQARINRIYYELQRLNIEKFVNSSSVLFRVFIELSIDHYAKKHNIDLKITPKAKISTRHLGTPKDMTLSKKLATVADYLGAKKICDRTELLGIRTLLRNRDHVLSVDSLHAYVHNMNYNPTPSDLKTTWDNIQVFVERLWTP